MIRDPRYKHTGSSATHEEAPDGRKGDWTKAQHLPRRGEEPWGAPESISATARQHRKINRI